MCIGAGCGIDRGPADVALPTRPAAARPTWSEVRSCWPSSNAAHIACCAELAGGWGHAQRGGWGNLPPVLQKCARGPRWHPQHPTATLCAAGYWSSLEPYGRARRSAGILGEAAAGCRAHWVPSATPGPTLSISTTQTALAHLIRLLVLCTCFPCDFGPFPSRTLCAAAPAVRR